MNRSFPNELHAPPESALMAGPVADENDSERRNSRVKLVKKTVMFELPSETDIAAGLDARTVYPKLRVAEDDLREAQRRREAHRQKLAELEVRAEHLGFAVSESGDADDMAAYDAARALLPSARDLSPIHDRLVANAEKRVTEAREAAREAATAEAHRRQAIINRAAAPLFAALQELQALERRLAEAAATVATPPGAGVLWLGSFREQAWELFGGGR
jgi:hypothetical protein